LTPPLRWRSTGPGSPRDPEIRQRVSPFQTSREAPRYLHLPSSQRSFGRQHEHPCLPQHALRRRRPSPQHTLHRALPAVVLQKSPPLRLQRRLRMPSVTISWPCASPAPTRPSADATSAAPASFIALPRVIAPVSRPAARSSKGRATLLPPLSVNNVLPPFQPYPTTRAMNHNVIYVATQVPMFDNRRRTPKRDPRKPVSKLVPGGFIGGPSAWV
jgi:hypothetical protein